MGREEPLAREGDADPQRGPESARQEPDRERHEIEEKKGVAPTFRSEAEAAGGSRREAPRRRPGARSPRPGGQEPRRVRRPGARAGGEASGPPPAAVERQPEQLVR